MKNTSFIGIDPSKADFAVCSLLGTDPNSPRNGLGKFDNTLAGYAKFQGRLLALGHERESALVCIENIGPYNERLAHYLHAEGWKVWLAIPGKIKHASGGYERAKTDSIDAERICVYACRFADKAQLFRPQPDWELELDALKNMRAQLVKDKARLSNQIHANSYRVKSNLMVEQMQAERLEGLKRSIHKVEEEMERIIKGTAVVAQVARILRSIEGIGPVIATNLIALTAGMTKVDSYRQLATLCCTAVVPHESGTSIRKRPRSTRTGDRHMKGLLYMGAMRTTQQGGIFREYYLVRKKQGKHHNSIINDIINKMLKLAFDLCKKCELFDRKRYFAGKKSPNWLLTTS
jgi:transposase